MVRQNQSPISGKTAILHHNPEESFDFNPLTVQTGHPSQNCNYESCKENLYVYPKGSFLCPNIL